jgi:DNA-binding NarL/FixJ family response regulator
VVVLSALADEATMLDAVRLGAQDYLIKGHFDAALLARVMRHAMERNQLLEQLESSLGYVRKLLQSTEGPAPGVESAATFAMCTGCKKLRAGSGRWETVEEFLAPRAQVQLTHETCPDCVSELEKET